jgi:hypothetical protein
MQAEGAWYGCKNLLRAGGENPAQACDETSNTFEPALAFEYQTFDVSDVACGDALPCH